MLLSLSQSKFKIICGLMLCLLAGFIILGASPIYAFEEATSISLNERVEMELTPHQAYVSSLENSHHKKCDFVNSNASNRLLLKCQEDKPNSDKDHDEGSEYPETAPGFAWSG